VCKCDGSYAYLRLVRVRVQLSQVAYNPQGPQNQPHNPSL
jgi:hypothetical protein